MRYRVTNATRNTLLGDAIASATTFGPRFKGLMGVTALVAGHGLYLAPCSSIHTFFMRLPIDALFLGDADTVIDVCHTLKPWRLSRWYPEASAVLELPAGIAAASRTEPGDRLAWEPHRPR